MLHQTALHATHEALGATLVDFGGWDMPLWYPTGAVKEHLAVIQHAGLFEQGGGRVCVFRRGQQQHGHAVPFFELQRQLLTGAAGNGLCDEHAVDAEGFVKGLCDRYGVLTGHRVDNEDRLVDFNGFLDIDELIHHGLVDLKTSCRIEEYEIHAFFSGMFHSGFRDIHRILVITHREDRNSDFLTVYL